MIARTIGRVSVCAVGLIVFAAGCGGGSDSDAAASIDDDEVATASDDAATTVDESAAAKIENYSAAVCSSDLLGDDGSEEMPATWGEFADETLAMVDRLRALSPPSDLALWHNVNLLTLNAMAEHAESQPRDDLFNPFDLLGVGLVMAAQVTEAERTVPEAAVAALAAHGCSTEDWGDDPFDDSDDAPGDSSAGDDTQSSGIDSDVVRDPDGAWQSYSEVDDFTDAVEVGARLEADNGFDLEVACGQNGFTVRLNVNTIFFVWGEGRSAEDFAMRFGDGTIEHNTWHLLPDDEWLGDDNDEWLVSPSPAVFAERLIDADGSRLLIRHGEDEDTGEFDLTGAATAITPAMDACGVT